MGKNRPFDPRAEFMSKEIEDAWAALGLPQHTPNTKNSLLQALDRAAYRVCGEVYRVQGLPESTSKEIVRDVADRLLVEWAQTLGDFDTTDLLSLVLAANKLSLSTIKEFIRALPDSLLQKPLQELPVLPERVRGVHILLALEVRYRANRSNMDYSLDRTPDGRVRLFLPGGSRGAGTPWSGFLDELYELP